MPIETADERSFMLQDFGVVVTHSGGSFVGIFDNAFADIDSGGGVSFAMSQPRLMCRTADISNLVEGELLTIEAASYAIRVIMPDGTGMTELYLEAQ